MTRRWPQKGPSSGGLFFVGMGVKVPKADLHLGGADEDGDEFLDARGGLFDGVRFDEVWFA
jgi:hypothetical protein